jgi:hypothetical protein
LDKGDIRSELERAVFVGDGNAERVLVFSLIDNEISSVA